MYAASIGWTLLIVALLIAGEAGWAAFRERRARRRAVERGRTLTAKYGLPWRPTSRPWA